jgi:hypothetical protein
MNVRLATEGRQRAGVLLDDLIVDQRQSEKRMAAAGKRDPIKHLTGSSALDRAIEMTKQMIRSMDELIAELRGDTNEAATDVQPIPSTPVETAEPAPVAGGAAR